MCTVILPGRQDGHAVLLFLFGRVSSVIFPQDPSALEHTLGNGTLDALLFSLRVSGES